MYNNIKTWVLLSVFIGVVSCKKWVEIPPPSTALESSLVFNNEAAAQSAVNGCYSQMMQTALSVSNGGMTLYPALSADELVNTAVNAEYDAFRLNELRPAATSLTRLWTFAYRNIYHANAVMEGLAKSGLPDSLKADLRGEMLVVRALNHFWLVNLFGEVPLALTTDYRVTQSGPRATVTAVYTSMAADLVEAKGLLKPAYPSAGRVRPNRWTASALLARLYLFSENWVAAEAEASEVINTGTYTLVPNLANVFLAGSAEAIWQLLPVSTTVNTAEGNTFNPSSATIRPTFAATPSLLGAFEAADTRKAAWLKSVVVSGQTYWYPYKYRVRTGAPPYTENYTVLRLAELYLIRAEARARLGLLVPAAGDLDRLRSRAGLPATIAATQPALLDAVMQERRVELLFELGARWLDLKRTGRVNSVLAALKPATWQSTDDLYPVPQADIESNPFLVQNPGY